MVTTIGCALGPCVKSAQRGGPGCHLCDVIAKLDQPRLRRVSDKDDLPKDDGRVGHKAKSTQARRRR